MDLLGVAERRCFTLRAHIEKQLGTLISEWEVCVSPPPVGASAAAACCMYTRTVLCNAFARSFISLLTPVRIIPSNPTVHFINYHNIRLMWRCSVVAMAATSDALLTS